MIGEYLLSKYFFEVFFKYVEFVEKSLRFLTDIINIVK